MDILHILFYFLVALGVLVTFHEAGHFLVARWTGVHVVRFCVGFGKPILTWRDKRGTEFAIAALPLGGYVRLYDRREADAAQHAPADPALAHRSYDRLKPQWRIAIALGGPGANFLLAFILYWLVAVVGVPVATPKIAVATDSPAYQAGLREGDEIVGVDGESTESWADIGMALVARLGDSGVIEFETVRDGNRSQRAVVIEDWLVGADDPDVIGALGLSPLRPAFIGGVLENQPAMEAGLRANDLITHVDGGPIQRWSEFVALVRESPEKPITLTVVRESDTQTVRVTPKMRFDDAGDEYGFVGVEAGRPTRILREGVFAALGRAASDTYSYSVLTVKLIGKMLTLDVSPKNVAGPITIAKVTSDSARAGFGQFVSLLALLSINLGLINLLPIPILDGGVVVMNGIELVRRKPPSARLEAMTARVGLAMVAGLMVFVFYVDILRWFWSAS